MKALKILLSVVMVAAFVLSLVEGTAMAVSVNISGAVTGTYTLNNMSIDSNGNITLNVSGSTSPPQEPLRLSLNPTTLDAGTVGSNYNQTVKMTASGGTGSYTYSCYGSGVQGLSASNNNSDTCTISGTPTAEGTYTVDFTVTDSDNATASNRISFSVSSSGGGGTTEGIKIPEQDPYYLNQSLGAGGIAKYYFVLDRDVKTMVGVGISGDWSTNYNVVLSKNGYVTKFICDRAAGYYCGIGGSDGARVAILTTGKKGDVWYVTVFNTSTTQGTYKIYWKAY